MRRSVAGFTFLELNTVVGVIGVLAALAIPNLVAHLSRAKGEEGELLVRAIAHRVAVAEEEGRGIEPCGPTPAEVPTEGPVPFEPDACWRRLGFTPDVVTWHQLELAVIDGEARAVARSDLDGDEVVRTVTYAPGDAHTTDSARGVW